MHQRNGMNAVIVQIRPACDAFYPSNIEPWSEWLTGQQGKPPIPYYDPLQFMIEETHKRGMEFMPGATRTAPFSRCRVSYLLPKHGKHKRKMVYVRGSSIARKSCEPPSSRLDTEIWGDGLSRPGK